MDAWEPAVTTIQHTWRERPGMPTFVPDHTIRNEAGWHQARINKARINKEDMEDSARPGPASWLYAAKPSAIPKTSSRISSPSFVSSTLVLHGGTTWMRLKFANGSSPRDLQAAMSWFISGLEDP